MLNSKNLNVFAGSEVADPKGRLTSKLPYELREFFTKNADLYRVGPDMLKYRYKLTYSALYNLSTFSYTEYLRRTIYRENNTKVIFSESFKTFLKNNDDKKVFRLILKGQHFANVAKCNYITLRKGEKLTFHPRPKTQTFTDSLDWRRDGRQEIKPLSLLILLFGTSVKKFICNKDIEEATNAIKNYMAVPRIEVAKSFEQIYQLGGDWKGQSSCMAGKGFTDLYENNDDIFEPIIFKIGGEIIGRCLRVSADQFTYYDRLYFKAAEHYAAIIDSIKAEGMYYYKTYNNIGETSFTSPDGIVQRREITVSAKVDTNWNLPYMDTLQYYNTDSDELTNDSTVRGYYLCSTSGGYDNANEGVYDEIDECYINEEDAVQIEFGRHQYSTTHRDNVYYSEGNDGYCLR